MRIKTSWRLKIELERDTSTGERRHHLVTVKGKRADAERELAKLLNASHGGMLIERSTETVAQYLSRWLTGAHTLAPKTRERFGQLIDQQISPHLGTVELQKLKPAQVANWHAKILKEGGKGGRPLSPATVTQAHRVLHLALAHAVKVETLARNVASAVSPPKAEKLEMKCLKSHEIADVLERLAGHRLFPIVALALGTGARRGELLALRWCDMDLEAGTARIERSLEQTKAGLRFKAPKTVHARRTVALPVAAVDALRSHRKAQLEQRIATGQGRPANDALIFSEVDGSPVPPSRVSGEWRDAVKALKLPPVSFHALRHSHASALIAAGVDIVTVSRRLGHASPVITLSVYSHLVQNRDKAVTAAIDAAMQR